MPLILLAVIFAANLQGEGFRNPPSGTFDLGRAGGRIAQVDDSSAVQQNPANLVGLTNTDIQFTPSVVYIGVNYQSPTHSANTVYPWKVVPNFFVSAPLKNDKLAFGFGVTVPYGLSMAWNRGSSAITDPTSWQLAAPYFAELKTINANPTISMRLCDQVTIGAGFDAMWSELKFNQFVAPGLAAAASGYGIGLGGNAGITWQITDRQRLAVTYRSPVSVDYSGHYNVPSVASGKFSSEINFPTIFSVGYGLQVSDAVRLESDVEWVEFSRFKNLPANLDGFASINTPENWKDTFTIGIGGDWKFATNWVARAGYQFYQSPVPDSTFSPMIPDANQNVFTVGLGYKYGHHSFEAAYGLDFYNNRNIATDQNAVFNGKYTFTVHLFSLAYHYSF